MRIDLRHSIVGRRPRLIPQVRQHAAGGSSSTVEINLGGQTLERWPPELFFPEPLAHQALEHFLNAGRRDPTLRWLETGGFPREVVWNGRAERQAWERENRTTRRDENEEE